MYRALVKSQRESRGASFLGSSEVVNGLGLLIHYNHVETLRMALHRAVSLPEALTLETGLRLP